MGLEKSNNRTDRRQRYVENRFTLGTNTNEATLQEISRLTSEISTARATEGERTSLLEQTEVPLQTYCNYFQSMHVELIHVYFVLAAFENNMER